MNPLRIFMLIVVTSLACILAGFGGELCAQENTETATGSDQAVPVENRSAADAQRLKETVNEAFRLTHGGWSSDEVVLDDDLYEAFIAKCNELFPNVKPEKFGWTLLNLRKAGQLKTKSTRRRNDDVSPVAHIAEIAARSTTDRFRISTDRMMIDPGKRAAFDEAALEVDANVDLYLVRKAVFKLRKARQLRPELITRIADWNRVVETYAVADILNRPELIPEHPGIYIFRDQTGYLYIGQTENLRSRLTTHLDKSHSQSLASYLEKHGAKDISVEIHLFDPSSRAKEIMVRRAYESELISSRKPRFNIQP